MIMNRYRIGVLTALSAAILLTVSVACGGETVREVIKEVPVEKVVTQEIVKEGNYNQSLTG